MIHATAAHGVVALCLAVSAGCATPAADPATSPAPAAAAKGTHEGKFDYGADASARTQAWCPGRVEDGEGNEYRTVLVGEQCWFAENLRVTQYRDGQPIGDDQHDTNDLKLYGRLYPWVVAAHPAGICPEGFEVPTDEDFQTFEKTLGMSPEAASAEGWRGEGFESRRIKAFDIDGEWTDEQRKQVNVTGFGALPSGLSVGWLGGGAGTYWESWTRTSMDDDKAWGRTLHWSRYRDSNRKIFRQATPKSRFYAVRCVKPRPGPGAPRTLRPAHPHGCFPNRANPESAPSTG